MNNKKGFTLIELLAVIVILAILLAFAIPKVNGYINNSRKDSFYDTAKEFADTVAKNIVLETYDAPIANNDVTIVNLNMIKLQKGGKKSSFNGKWIDERCYVAVVNIGTEVDPEYEYYVTLSDSKRYGFDLILANDLSAKNIVRYSTVNDLKNSITELYGNKTGKNITINNIVGLEKLKPSDINWNATIYTNN